MTTGLRFDPRRHAWLAYLLAGGVVMAVFLALPPGTLLQSVVYDLAAISAVAAILAGVVVHRPAVRLPWLLMAAGLFTFFIGDVLWVVYAELGEDPFPSLADFFYLAGYPVLAAGLVLGIRTRSTGGDRSGLLDASILATSAAVLAWTFQIGPLAASLEPEPLAFGITLAYPIMDLILIGVGIGLLTTPGARTMSFRLIAISLFALLFADQLYAVQTAEETYIDGGVLDLAWILSYLAWGAAALHPSMRALFDPRPVVVALLGPVRILFLGAAMLTGPALLAFAQPSFDPGLTVIAAGTAVLSILVLIRLAGLVRLLSADIAQRRILEAELSFQANHDPLTHLTNRRLFVARVEQELSLAGDGPSELAVLFLDLDDFKTVNDSLGHAAGDSLLVEVAQRIRSCLRDVDVAARLGGDEFAVLLRRISGVDEAAAIAERIAATLVKPFPIDGSLVPIAASIGIAVPQPGATVDALLRSADIAMYVAKARGKDRQVVYAPGLEIAAGERLVTRTDPRPAGEPGPTVAPASAPSPALRPHGA